MIKFKNIYLICVFLHHLFIYLFILTKFTRYRIDVALGIHLCLLILTFFLSLFSCSWRILRELCRLFPLLLLPTLTNRFLHPCWKNQWVSDSFSSSHLGHLGSTLPPLSLLLSYGTQLLDLSLLSILFLSASFPPFSGEMAVAMASASLALQLKATEISRAFENSKEIIAPAAGFGPLKLSIRPSWAFHPRRYTKNSCSLYWLLEASVLRITCCS